MIYMNIYMQMLNIIPNIQAQRHAHPHTHTHSNNAGMGNRVV